MREINEIPAEKFRFVGPNYQPSLPLMREVPSKGRRERNNKKIALSPSQPNRLPAPSSEGACAYPRHGGSDLSQALVIAVAHLTGDAVETAGWRSCKGIRVNATL